MKSVNYIYYLFTIGLLIIGLVSCEQLLPSAPDTSSTLAQPLEGLTGQQLNDHLSGDEAFGHSFSPAEGLGPLYVAVSCESCHIGDGKGHPLTTLTRFNGAGYDPLIEYGGPQLQHRAIPGYPAEEIPSMVIGMSKLMPPAVAGLGFLEAVSDADILALSDPNDVDGNGISGVPSYVNPPEYFIPTANNIPKDGKYIGRFGKKTGAIDLLHQTANAYRNDMGITSDFSPYDLYNVQAGNNTGDDVPEPEIGSSVVQKTAFYMRTLQAPPRRNTTSTEVMAGENIFKQIGCTNCHIPSLRTGTSTIAALSNKIFYPYTDLLLHDMGEELNDNYTEGSALPSEWRTAPLWGTGLVKDAQGGKTFFLHDGRAKNIAEAIEYHGGEGSSSRSSFRQLTSTEKEQLYTFIESL